jgi:hypothetical protein
VLEQVSGDKDEEHGAILPEYRQEFIGVRAFRPFHQEMTRYHEKNSHSPEMMNIVNELFFRGL